jgi:predicted alpha-1,2-mannosidase
MTPGTAGRMVVIPGSKKRKQAGKRTTPPGERRNPRLLRSVTLAVTLLLVVITSSFTLGNWVSWQSLFSVYQTFNSWFPSNAEDQQLAAHVHAGQVRAADLALTPYVDPFIGTAPGGSSFGFDGDSGDTFPGAAYPMGMLQWSPDTPSRLPGGYYYPDSTITGFSLTHFSGRGCRVYQDIPFLPMVGPVTASPATSGPTYWSHFSHSTESAHPGYYRVQLADPHVTVELTATPRTSFGQFTYPASTASTMLINAGGSAKGTTHAQVTITGIHQVSGSATSMLGCGTNPYTIYFAASFDRPFSSFGTWNGRTVTPGSSSSTGSQSGAFVTFDTTFNRVVQVKVGISFVSRANAEANVTSENPGWDLTRVRQAAAAAWNARLNSIQVQGGTDDEKRIFYTALYHAFFHPNLFNDVNGQYLGFDGHVHTVASGHAQYEDISGWDLYRSLMPLRAILAPAETSDIAQSLVNDAQQGDGHVPRWEQANADSRGMNGDHGDALIAQAYAFGATGFDAAAALRAMETGQAKIRQGLNDYLSLGYVAAGTANNAVALTEEYSIDDFSIAQLARALGDASTSKLYRRRSGNWQQVFNTLSGYMQPRKRDGSWAAHFSPISQSGFREGNATQYSWMVPFNLRSLFEKMGGNTRVVSRLDTFFTRLNEGPDSPYAFMGNEPCFAVPWAYDFAGAPWRTQQVIRQIQTHLYHPTPGGLPGNDDGGALSSWYVFSALGLYPEIPGVGGFVVGSPLFSSVTVRLAGGQTLQINAPGAADATPYVQSLHLDGQATTNLWMPWQTVEHGATLDFALSGNPTSWGSNPADAPPSYPASVGTS